ncbi:MAG: hypothetical protein A4E52_01595 [Pelotomaculum sp. PtaB.Bin013]|uniref:DUF5320 domain-containing protein n=1 Tax=Pelotomaculum isophthalicicum JI TaxID=947010 RepID=A0A9X4H7P4_9FIRM|nr:DUF5320 domain-containing protein [Pelotomaculum isophthalicicum]MDF9409824.1 DUF5320 domain-containing protein [Pelotomaculum isophthalicicum JI]OPX85813.1 MAG: hypothetical protein A4E52_01595 [Pelotomaculum sp. PtaB.Bin013]
MPGFNGKGPLGMGAMTGRGRGFCISSILPGTSLALKLGRGGQRGWWRSDFATGMLIGLGGYFANSLLAKHVTLPASGEDELNLLKEEAGYLESALEQIRKHIKELENKD